MSDIIVRMPPSPTGSLHLGTARTALFNYLFAKSQGGEIVFRWEDTDRERSKKEYETEIMEGLRWLGMDFEKESKMVVRQSENSAYHEAKREKLWESGKIFPCFVTTEVVEQQKKEAEKNRTNFVFWSPHRDQSAQELQDLMDQGKPFVWRLRTPRNKIISYTDPIRGPLEVNTETLGDFTIARADGSILYLLANVLDDLQQGITHVIKGEDHISNTPKQLLLWEALGEEPPLYAHIPLVLDTKGAKLSKRKVDQDVCVLIKDFQAQGFLAEAVVNGLVLLGWHPKTEEEIFSMQDLIQRFTLEGINKAGSKYDFEKMKWFNNAWMRKIEVGALAERFLAWQEMYPPDKGDRSRSDRGGLIENNEKLQKALAIAREKAKTFQDLEDELQYILFSISPINPENLVNEKMKVDKALSAKVLHEVAILLQNIPEDEFKAETIKERSIEKIAEMGLKNGQFLSPFRYALSGRDRSIGPFDLCEIMGREESLRRIKEALPLG